MARDAALTSSVGLTKLYQWLIPGVLLLTIFEGAFRKWLFPSSNLPRYVAYFSKDMLFVYVAWLAAPIGSRFRMHWFAICGLLIVASSFIGTLSNSNIVGLVLSVRAYLVLPLCAYIVASFLKRFADVEKVAKAVAVAAVVVALLGAYQYFLPATHWLNRYDSGSDDTNIAEAGSHVRAVGTFSYIGGMAIMGGLAAWAGMFLALPLRGRSPKTQTLGAVAVVCGLICALVAMSRSSMMFWLVTVVGSFVLHSRAKAGLFLIFAIAAFFVSAGFVGEMFKGATNNSIASGFADRAANSDSFSDRFSYVINNLTEGLFNHPLGEGLGTGQPGGTYAATGTRDSHAYYETEWARIAYEVGVPGLMAVLFVRFYTLWMCWQAYTIWNRQDRRLVLSTAIPFFGIMSLNWMAFNHVGNSAAWVVMATALCAASARSNSRGWMRHGQ